MAKRAELKASLSLSTANFSAGIAKATAAAARMAKFMTTGALGKAASGAGNFAKGFVSSMATLAGKIPAVGFAMSTLKGGMTALGGAAGVMTEKLISGATEAMEFASNMHIVSERTGISAGRLSVLKRELGDAGIEFDSLSTAVKKMDVAMISAVKGGTEASGAFQQIGLSAKDLLKMSPEAQFLKIGKAIGALENPAARAAASVAIFGRSGADLTSFFGNAESMERAAGSLGRQAQLLNQNSETFHQITVRLSHVSGKITGFFVGFASGLVALTNNFSKQFDKLDFTKFGEKLAERTKDAMKWGFAIFEDPMGTTGFFWETAKAKALELANWMHDGIERSFPGMGVAIEKAISKTIAWGQILSGYAISFGQHLVAGVTWAMQTLADLWDKLGMGKVMDKVAAAQSKMEGWLISGANVGRKISNIQNVPDMMARQPGESSAETAARKAITQRGLDAQLAMIGGPSSADDYKSGKTGTGTFGNVLASIEGSMGGNGSSLVQKGLDALAQGAEGAAKALESAKIGADHFGAVAQAQKAAAMRKVIAPAIAKAEARMKALQERPPLTAIASSLWHGNLVGASSPVGASMLGNPWHALAGGAYGQSSLLSHAAIRRIQQGSESVADIEARHRLGNVRKGDAAKVKALNQEKFRKQISGPTETDLLSKILEQSTKMNQTWNE